MSGGFPDPVFRTEQRAGRFYLEVAVRIGGVEASIPLVSREFAEGAEILRVAMERALRESHDDVIKAKRDADVVEGT